MKKATGFITHDGTFFENEKEAVLHEAEVRLRAKLGDVQDNFLSITLNVMPELREYINAASSIERDRAEEREEAKDRGEAKTSGSAGHVSSTEEDLASLLKLPTRGRSDLSDVGGGPRTKKVSDRRAKHGA